MDGLEEALRAHGRPEIVNTDQGSPFTSTAVTGVLLREEIAIRMDGRGRALDNLFVERLWRSVKRDGPANQSYGLAVAALAGVPASASLRRVRRTRFNAADSRKA